LTERELNKFLDGLPVKEPPADPALKGKDSKSKSKSKEDPSAKFQNYP
jgi:hypothetical protein